MKSLTVLMTVALLVPSAAMAAPDLFQGKKLYNAYCSACHGLNGKGGGPLAGALAKMPSNLIGDKYQTMEHGELSELVVGYGRGDSLMPKWGDTLTARQLTDVVGYVQKIDEPGMVNAGDAERGKVVYEQTCTACHGADGGGGGILAEMIGAEAADLTGEAVADLTTADIEGFVSDGGGYLMPAWKEVLTPKEIRDVAVYAKSLNTAKK